MPQDLKDSLEISLDELVINYQQQMNAKALDLGRAALLKHEWKEARRHFKEALSMNSYSIKKTALLGLLFAFCKVDFEWLATILKKPRLK